MSEILSRPQCMHSFLGSAGKKKVLYLSANHVDLSRILSYWFIGFICFSFTHLPNAMA